MQCVKNIHFIGIGGSGMSGIAEVLLSQGYIVSGSDIHENTATTRLSNLGIKIFIGHDEKNIVDADIVVVSSAIAAENPELSAAHKMRKPVLPRAQMLAELMRFQYGIAVCGTHGKTTTTSLIASVLAASGVDPTFVIGGVLNSVGANARLGDSEYFVAEADESDASFLRLQPMIAVVTNIEEDHMLTYDNDFKKLQQAFIDFLHNLPFYGLAVVCYEDQVIRNILPEIARPTTTYGYSDKCDIYAEDCQQIGMTCTFKVHRKNLPILDVKLNLPGKHNILNALAAIAVATECKVADSDIVDALAEFKGVGRRLQMHGDFTVAKGKFTLIDDYGHHPTEIAASISALRAAWPGRRLVLAFQPHRYSRLQSLFDDFARELSETDVLLLLEVYPAGEQPIQGISSKSLAHSIRQRGRVEPIVLDTLDDLMASLPNVINDDDVLLLQGAGSVGGIVAKIKTRQSICENSK